MDALFHQHDKSARARRRGMETDQQHSKLWRHSASLCRHCTWST